MFVGAGGGGGVVFGAGAAAGAVGIFFGSGGSDPGVGLVGLGVITCDELSPPAAAT